MKHARTAQLLFLPFLTKAVILTRPLAGRCAGKRKGFGGTACGRYDPAVGGLAGDPVIGDGRRGGLRRIRVPDGSRFEQPLLLFLLLFHRPFSFPMDFFLTRVTVGSASLLKHDWNVEPIGNGFQLIQRQEKSFQYC